jgi:hypothetical protein
MNRILLGTVALLCGLCASVAWAAGEEDWDTSRVRLLGHDWERLYKPGRKKAEFGERFMHRGTVHGDQMIISGGYNMHDMYLGDVWASEDGTDWKCLTEKAPWSERFAHGLVSLDGTLYLMGGFDGELRNDVWKSADGADWELVTESAGWSPRSHFQALVHNGAIFVMGGKGMPERYADVWTSTDGAEWELLNANAWPARSHFGAVSHNGEIVILGGGYYSFQLNYHFYHRDTWSSPDGKEWTLLNSNLPMRRRVLMEMVSVGPYIYAIGGDDKPWYTYMRRDAWVSPDGVDWMKLREKGNLGQRSRLDWETRIDHVLLAKDDAIYLIGGHSTYSGTFQVSDRFGYWTTANVWKTTGVHHPNFVPEYGPEDEKDEEIETSD